jgi:hypothetical protein
MMIEARLFKLFSLMYFFISRRVNHVSTVQHWQGKAQTLQSHLRIVVRRVATA